MEVEPGVPIFDPAMLQDPGTSRYKLEFLPPFQVTFNLASCRSVLDFEKLCSLGQGAFGVVYKAKHKKTSNIVALKKVNLSLVDSHIQL